jgi:uncharacterized protein YbaR (Trm112 family)
MPLGLDPDLLDILACPAPDHGTLRPGTPDDLDAAALTCTACDRRYPVTDGIPVLLLSEASGGPAAEPGPGSRLGTRSAAEPDPRQG